MTMFVSHAVVDITPEAGFPMGGYGGSSARFSTGVYDSLRARCVVLWDDGVPRIIVSADILGWPRAMFQAIRQGIVDQNQVDNANIILVGTHTHNGPALENTPDAAITYGVDPTTLTAYGTWLQSRIGDLVNMALGAPQIPCTIDYRVTSQTWSANREGLLYTETAVPVIVARDGTGIPRAIVFSYGCHPVVAGSQTLWDGDYPATACAVIEAAIPGCVALFLPGAFGDQDPVGSRGLALRNTRGVQLGSAVVAATESPGRPVAGPVVTSYQEVDLPLDVTSNPVNLAAVRAVYQARMAAPGLPSWYARHAQAMIERIDAGDIETTVPLPLQVWRLQGTPDLRICVTGGELVSGYAVYFRAQFGGVAGLMIGGGAEVECYVPSNELLPPIRIGGSYAGGWDTDYPGVAGGSQTIYPHLGHFRSGVSGVENTLITALTAQLT